MFVATVIVTVALAAAMFFAAVRKLSHAEAVVASYSRVGVREDKLNYLAVVLLVGAAGLLAGLVWAPLGIAAGVSVIAYFALAVGAHISHDDIPNLPTPAVLLTAAVVAFALRLLTI